MKEWIKGEGAQMVGGSCQGQEVGNIEMGKYLEDEFVGEGEQGGAAGGHLG